MVCFRRISEPATSINLSSAVVGYRIFNYMGGAFIYVRNNYWCRCGLWTGETNITEKRRRSWESQDFGRPKNALLKWEIWPKMKGLHLSEMKGDGPCLKPPFFFGAFISIHGNFRRTPRPTIVSKPADSVQALQNFLEGGHVWQGGHRWHSFPWWSCKLTSWPPFWDLMAHAEDTSFLFSFHIP